MSKVKVAHAQWFSMQLAADTLVARDAVPTEVARLVRSLYDEAVRVRGTLLLPTLTLTATPDVLYDAVALRVEAHVEREDVLADLVAEALANAAREQP